VTVYIPGFDKLKTPCNQQIATGRFNTTSNFALPNVARNARKSNQAKNLYKTDYIIALHQSL